MDHMLELMVPLGLGVLLSPEVLVLGLLIGSSKEKALKKSWLFFIAGLAGLFICTAAGFFLEHAAAAGPSITRFILRTVIGAIFLLLGLHLLIKGHKKIEATRLIDKVKPVWAFLFGFMITGLNLKIITLSMTAGHELRVSTLPSAVRIAGLGVFLGLGLVPLIIPALLETARSGLVSTVMKPCNYFLMKYGRWVGVIICLAMAAVTWKGALAVMP